MLTEFDTSDEELPESNDPYEVPKNEDEWIESITSTRKNDRMTAIQNIKKNQKVQKITYDRKVKRNRYVINITCSILVTKSHCVKEGSNNQSNFCSRIHSLNFVEFEFDHQICNSCSCFKLRYFHFLFANFDSYVFHALGMKCDFILINNFLLRK